MALLNLHTECISVAVDFSRMYALLSRIQSPSPILLLLSSARSSPAERHQLPVAPPALRHRRLPDEGLHRIRKPRIYVNPAAPSVLSFYMFATSCLLALRAPSHTFIVCLDQNITKKKTVNERAKIEPGEIYINRQYMILDRFVETASRASSWVNETLTDRYTADSVVGTALTYASDGTSFGIIAATAESGSAGSSSSSSCAGGGGYPYQCQGSTTPHGMSNTSPRLTFHVRCGTSTYTGPDRYAFAPERGSESDPLRPYVCDGQADGTARPAMMLLGYFGDDCAFAPNAAYDDNFCGSTEVSDR
uniref:Uncharacterized protein n=1 Tax=Odontella aurita TaxID=265563 RepID=A0A7S4KCC7_9STRA|mmetsp:Transcript_934/g.2690  ORF Transcript_934/g.2690 Transcript_934/m.2690 type:complete len:305 (+) Transcript_934:307-1221(+)